MEVTDTEKKIGPPHGQKSCGKREKNNSKGLEERLGDAAKKHEKSGVR